MRALVLLVLFATANDWMTLKSKLGFSVDVPATARETTDGASSSIEPEKPSPNSGFIVVAQTVESTNGMTAEQIFDATEKPWFAPSDPKVTQSIKRATGTLAGCASCKTRFYEVHRSDGLNVRAVFALAPTRMFIISAYDKDVSAAEERFKRMSGSFATAP